MDWPRVETKSTKLLTEYKFIGGSWLPLLMSYVMLATVFLPYCIVLVRGTLHPFLPYVSQVAGSPPQSGVFNILLVVSSLLAFIGHHLLYMSIRVQKHKLKDDWIIYLVSLLNNISLVPGHIGLAGMIIVGSFPLDFYRSSPEWVNITVIPHALGAMSLFLGGLFYCILMTYILSLLHPEQKQTTGIRIFLICLITMCSALQGITVHEGFWSSEKEDIPKNCVISRDSIPYNLSYLISSVSEWALVFFFIIFFMTLKDEARDICFTMSVTIGEEPEKSTIDEKLVEDKKSDPGTSNLLEESQKEES